MQHDDGAVDTMVCDVCFGLQQRLIEQYAKSTQYDHFDNGALRLHIDVSLLGTSANSGCICCRVLLRAREMFYSDAIWMTAWVLTGSTMILDSSTQDPPMQVYTRTDGFKSSQQCKELQRAFAHAPLRLPKRSDSSTSLRFLRECLYSCEKLHSTCPSLHPTSASYQMPTRLLQIDADHNVSWRLVQTPDRTNGPYAALSYCWGKAVFAKTTRANIRRHLKRTSVYKLPVAFRDAISICRSAGIHRLWIDSLCIIQNDEQDWATESAKMADIFANAIFVIAAMSISSPEESLLAKSSTDVRQFALFDETEVSGMPQIFAKRTTLSGCQHSAQSAQSPTSLDKRGWAFQESFLATRMLCYTNNEVQWACAGLATCECGSPVRPLIEVPRYSVNVEDPFRMWEDCVYDFATRALSFRKDKLPALAGVASRVFRMTKSAYVAGLWRDRLLEELSWERQAFEVSGSESSALDPHAYYGPSFSWTSAAGAVVFAHRVPHDRIADDARGHRRPDASSKGPILLARSHRLTSCLKAGLLQDG